MVNRGYQKEDEQAIDYQLWKMPGVAAELRGPPPAELPRRFFVAIGAAQTFGRFTEKPYCQLVADGIGLAGINLGFSGAGPTFFSRDRDLLEVINRAEFAIVQLMSGRSLSNSRFTVQRNQGLVRPCGGAPDVAPVFAEHAYRRFLREETIEEIVRLRAEIRLHYVAETNALLDKIKVPTILLYWSTRTPDYQEGVRDIGAYWGAFPHFVNSAVIAEIRSHADFYVEAVTGRGLPQPIYDRAGNPLLMWPEDRFPQVQLRTHNHYYPSPQMHEDAAAALLKALPVQPTPRAAPAQRDVLVHVRVFQGAGNNVDESLRRHFGADWRNADAGAGAGDAFRGDRELLDLLADEPSVAAISSHRLRFPLRGDDKLRLHPFLLLRHPIDRVRAIYEYERSQTRPQASQTGPSGQAGEPSLPQWVDWRLGRPELEARIGNLQTRACSFRHNGRSPQDWRVRPNMANLREALAVISELPVIGIVEEFRLTAALLAATFAPLFPGLEFLDPAEKPTDEAERLGLAQRLEAMRKELGDPLYLRLLKANELDLELYAHARRRLGLAG